MLDIFVCHVSWNSNFIFTHQVDQKQLFDTYMRQTCFFKDFFTKDLLVNSSRYLLKDAL
jgi:hypothetical protein